MMIMNTTIMIFILIIVLTSLCSLGSSSKYDSSPGYIFHIRIRSPGRIHLPHQNTVPREDTFTPKEYSPKEGYVYHISITIQSPEWIILQNQNTVLREDIFTTSESYLIFVLFCLQTTIFGPIFLHTKVLKSRQNRFRDKTA